MALLRAFFLRHRALALLVVMAALCMKIVVPAGFMIGADAKVLSVQICDEGQGTHSVMQIVVPAKAGQAAHKQGMAAKGGECPYSAVAMAAIGGAGPVLLALALAYIVALGFAAAPVLMPRGQRHLRPPLRGPPRFA
jgi:hypothetical protein